ncbi:MAG: c-type cytochrome [Deferrisomatales bacterium]
MTTRTGWRWALTLTVGLYGLAAAAPSDAADAAALYQDLCAGCHGDGGEGVGDLPPLFDAGGDLDYVAAFIRDGGADMPAFPYLTEEEVEGLAVFVAGLAAGAEGLEPSPAPPPLPAGDPDRGRAYFTGSVRLAAGGAPCLACHVAGSHGPVSGGTLGSDLTDVARRFGGAAGLFGVFRTMPFPLMRASYAGKALSEQERADLAAFFVAVAEAGTTPSGWADRFWVPALAGAAVLFAVVAVIGSRRGPSPARRLRESLKPGRAP